MHSYSTLPSLVLNEIFSYLNYKERIKAKSVCRSWKGEIDYKDKHKDGLIFHFGDYPLNRRWSWSNNRRLIGVENSFEIKSLDFLRLDSTRNYFKSLKKINICNTYTVFTDLDLVERPQKYINLFEQCEELELFGFEFKGSAIFKLNKLRVLVLRKTHCDYLKLNCPKLEVFICWSNIAIIEYKYENKLKYMECYNSCLEFKSSALRFTGMQTLNFYNLSGSIRKDVLSYMPNLKKLLLFTSFGKQDLNELQRQKRLYGLNELEILCSGFKDATVMQTNSDGTFVLERSCLKAIFNHYPKFVEPIAWDCCIDYNALFDQFKILPKDFFTKVPLVGSVYFHRVENYKHLFEFLKHCPMLDCLTITTCEIQKRGFLNTLFLLTPSLRILNFREDCVKYTSFNLTFLANLKVINIRLEAPFLSLKFLRKIYKFSRYLVSFNYIQSQFGSKGFDVSIFKNGGYFNVTNTMGMFRKQFITVEDAIEFFKRDDLIKKIIK